MLILTRRANEAVTIGDDIEVRVLSIKRGQVRIGFTAPKDVSIQRDDMTTGKKPERSADNAA